MAGKKPKREPRVESTDERQPSELRIIGGQFRGRRLIYSGRFATRPMKDRVREAAFNLIGPTVVGKHAIDLFAGTGALGLEAVSRGAAAATLIELHVPTAKVIRENIERLEITDLVTVVEGSAFGWLRLERSLPTAPWLVFCSPPFAFYTERAADMLKMIEQIVEAAPLGSLLVVEADATFDFGQLPQPDRWRLRAYPPAVLGLLLLEADEEPSAE